MTRSDPTARQAELQASKAQNGAQAGAGGQTQTARRAAEAEVERKRPKPFA